MYNGIGLQTPRGSGTNGYVQKNWATVRMPKDRVNYRTEEEIAKLDSASNKPPNREILDHERKRKIEVKCTELEDSLEEQGLPKGEIAARVAAFRAKISDAGGDKNAPRDEFGRVAVRETHAVAEAQQEKNARLRDAFGISPRFVEGSSLDQERRARDEARRYPLVRTPSHEREEAAPSAPAKKKKKRSASPETKKSKKKKSKKNKKEKQETTKKKKKRAKSTDTDNSSSSDQSPESDSASSDDERQKKKKKKKSGEKRRHSSDKSSREGSVAKTKKQHKQQRALTRDHDETYFKKKEEKNERGDENRLKRQYDCRDDGPAERHRAPRDQRSSSPESSPQYRHRSSVNKIENKKHGRSDDHERPEGSRRTRRDPPHSAAESDADEPNIKRKADKKDKKKAHRPREDSATPPPEKRRRRSPSQERDRREEESCYSNKRGKKDHGRNYRERSDSRDKRYRRSESHEIKKIRDDDTRDKREKHKERERGDKHDGRDYERKYIKSQELLELDRSSRTKPRHDSTEEPPRRGKNLSPSRGKYDSPPGYRSNSPANKGYGGSRDSVRRDKDRYKKSVKNDKKSSSESESDTPPPREKLPKTPKNRAKYKEQSESPVRERSRRSPSLEYVKNDSPIQRYRATHGKTSSKNIEKRNESSRRKRSPSPYELEVQRRSRSVSPVPNKKKSKIVSPLKRNKRSLERRLPSPKGSRNDRCESSKHRNKRGGKSELPRDRSRSRGRSGSTSSLSYSPARRSPERYRDIIENLPEKDKRKYIRSPSDLKPKKKKKKEKIEDYNPRMVCLKSSSSENEDSEVDFLRLDERDRQDDLELNKLKEKLVQMAKASMERKRTEENIVAPSTSQVAKASFVSTMELKKSPSPKKIEKEKSPEILQKGPQKEEERKIKSKSPQKANEDLQINDIRSRRGTWSRSRSGSSVHSISRSRSRVKSSRSRSRSRGKSSRSRSKSKSRSRSRSRSSRSRSRSYSSSRHSRTSRSSSYSSRSSSRSSRSSSRSSRSSRSRSSRSRSPSIPRRAGSPSFLDRRRITSARKRPIPYRRPTPSTPSSVSYDSSPRSSQHSWTRSPRPLHD